jgi:transposase-like protein
MLRSQGDAVKYPLLPYFRSLAKWVREAREAGLDDESIESLLRVTLQASPEEEIA